MHFIDTGPLFQTKRPWTTRYIIYKIGWHTTPGVCHTLIYVRHTTHTAHHTQITVWLYMFWYTLLLILSHMALIHEQLWGVSYPKQDDIHYQVYDIHLFMCVIEPRAHCPSYTEYCVDHTLVLYYICSVPDLVVCTSMHTHNSAHKHHASFVCMVPISGHGCCVRAIQTIVCSSKKCWHTKKCTWTLGECVCAMGLCSFVNIVHNTSESLFGACKVAVEKTNSACHSHRRPGDNEEQAWPQGKGPKLLTERITSEFYSHLCFVWLHFLHAVYTHSIFALIFKCY